MSKLSRALGALMLCVGMLISASVVLAYQDQSTKNDKGQKKEQKKTESPAPADQTVTLSGKVTAVSDGTVTFVDDQKAEHTVAVTADTKVTKVGKDAAVTDVKANDMVTVVAKKGEGDSLTAIQIAVA